MTEAAVLDSECFQTTDGEIAIVNLNSARLRSWSRFYQDPQQPGAAETVLEHEQLTAQFASDLSALDRMEAFAERLGQLDASSARTHDDSGANRLGAASLFGCKALSRAGKPWRRAVGRREAHHVECRSGVRLAPGRGAGRAAQDRCEIRSICGSCGARCTVGGSRRIRRGRRDLPAGLARIPGCFAVSRWPGSAFSWACCGANLFRNQNSPAPSIGIARRLSVCLAM